jgi:hypothetical protein
VGGRPGGRVLDIAKIQLTQSSLVELELGLSLAINEHSHQYTGHYMLVCLPTTFINNRKI